MPGIKEIASGRSDIYKVKFADLNVKEGWNSRDYDTPENVEHVKVIGASIASEGVKEAMTGWMEDGLIYIENGHMRHRAIAWAVDNVDGFDVTELLIPIQISSKELSDADRLLSQITRNSGKSLAPLEMATLFDKLKAADPELTDAEIARRAGISRVYVGNLVSLAKQPKTITKFVRSGDVSATLAIDIINRSKGDPKRAAELMRLTVEAAKALGKKATKKQLDKVDATKKKPDENAGGAGGEGGEGGEAGSETTAKARKPSALTLLDSVKAIFDNDTTVEQDGEETLVVMTHEKYAELVELLGLKSLGQKIDDAANSDGETATETEEKPEDDTGI